MNFIRMAKDNLLKNLKEYYVCMGTYAISVIVIFNILNSTYDKEIFYSSDMSGEVLISNMTIMLVIVIIAFLMCCYISNYYGTTKVRDIGIIGISGGAVEKTAIYIGVQNIILQGIGIIIGLLLAVLSSPIYNYFIKINLEIERPILYISPEAIGLTIVVIIIEFVMSVLVSTGFCYRRTILELMNYNRTTFERDKRLFKKPTAMYFITYILGLVSIYYLAGEKVGPVIWLNMIMCVGGAMGTIRFGIPKYLDKKRKSGKLYDSERSVWSGNVINLIMKISPLMAFIMVAISSTIGPVLNSIDVSYSTIFITNIQLFSLLALLSFAIIFKMLIEINNRKIIYRNLKFIGYSDEKLKSIIKKEMFIFYSIFLVLTFIPLIIMGASSIIRNCLLIKELIQIIIAPLITIIILGVISYKLYKDRVFRMIKG